MSLSAKLRRAPMRAVTGAFILGSGVEKLGADEETAKQLHGLASGTYGFLGKLDPNLFAKALGAGEIALGSALLLPVVPPVVAGAGLIGFSGAVLNMYWNTEGMHADGSPKPTQAGIPIAKDVWLLGIGVGLVADSLFEPAHDKKLELATTVHEKRNRRAKLNRKSRKAAKKARAEAKANALDAAKSAQADLTKRARKAAKKAVKRAQKSDALKRAQHASDRAAKRIADVREEYVPVVAEKAKQARDAAKDARDEYGPAVVEKAKQARDVAKDLRDEYGPVVVEKAKQARAAGSQVLDEYRPVIADRSKRAGRSARKSAREAAERAQVAAAKAREAAERAKLAATKARDRATS